MVRVTEILERVPLVVRGLRRVTGKQVRLELDAGDAELDKAVAERLFPAILHLVTNAVDHGIELPEERRAAGKPEEGWIRITTFVPFEPAARSSSSATTVAASTASASPPAPLAEAPTLGRCAPRAPVPSRTLDTRRGPRRRAVAVWAWISSGASSWTNWGESCFFRINRAPGRRSRSTFRSRSRLVDAFTTECGDERFVVPVSTVEEIVEVDPEQVVNAPLAIARRCDAARDVRAGEGRLQYLRRSRLPSRHRARFVFPPQGPRHSKGRSTRGFRPRSRPRSAGGRRPSARASIPS